MSDQQQNITLYGIPNCDTVKKARTWLDTYSLAHTFHNFKKDGVTPVMIEAWLKDNDWEVLLNRKGTTWRALDNARKAVIIDAATSIALMCESPSVIKRPVLTIANADTLPSRAHIRLQANVVQQADSMLSEPPASPPSPSLAGGRGERSESPRDFHVYVGFSEPLYQQIFKK